ILLAQLPSNSNHTLLYTNLLSSASSIPTLVDSSATNNFIDKSLAALALQHLQNFSTPILLKLFDGNPLSAEDITHCVETTVTFK
ncbi:hypothetical protein C0989_004300, partial [Termitomyces sp. Mn162]